MPINFGSGHGSGSMVSRNTGSGEFWYDGNSDTYTLYANSPTPYVGDNFEYIGGLGIWTIAPNMQSSVHGNAGFGSQLAGVWAGGYDGSNRVANCNEWNGVTWVAGGNLGTARNNASGLGSLLAGVVGGGYRQTGGGSSNLCETYNGTSWSAANACTFSTGDGSGAGAGGSLGGLKNGGGSGGGVNDMKAQTETWNGTSWSSVSSMPMKRDSARSCGSPLAAFTGCSTWKNPDGGAKESTQTCLQYDGSSWSYTVNSPGAARRGTYVFGHPTACVNGPGEGDSATTEEFDGTAFTVGNDCIKTNNFGIACGGTQSAAICAGGEQDLDGSMRYDKFPIESSRFRVKYLQEQGDA